MILRGTVYPRSICPREHMVLGPHVWRTSPPRTGSPGGHVEGGTFETTTTVPLAQSSLLQVSLNWRSQQVAEKVSELLLYTARSIFVQIVAVNTMADILQENRKRHGGS